MKKSTILASLLLGFVTASVQAGGEVYKQVAPPPPPPELYGLGFYGAIDGGANVYQNRGGDRTITDDNPNSPFFEDTLTFSPKNNVGGYGGIKAGYVFGTGVFRPTVEGDFFWNGFKGGGDFTLREPDGDLIRSSSVNTTINTGAFMGNFIGRFAFGRFQPYVGGGVGVYYAESAGVDVTTPRGTFSTGGGKNHADFAWQVIAGADYYWNPKFSTFIEYHYLVVREPSPDVPPERPESDQRDNRQHDVPISPAKPPIRTDPVACLAAIRSIIDLRATGRTFHGSFPPHSSDVVSPKQLPTNCARS